MLLVIGELKQVIIFDESTSGHRKLRQGRSELQSAHGRLQGACGAARNNEGSADFYGAALISSGRRGPLPGSAEERRRLG